MEQSIGRSHRSGQVGTVVELLADGAAFEVEFGDRDGLGSDEISLVESMGAIMPRTSLLEPCVQLSSHTAPDSLKDYSFCPCGCNYDRIHVGRLDLFSSNCYDSRRCGANVPVLHWCILIHNVHRYGFAFLRF